MVVSHVQAVRCLLALLRAGEQSAEHAFGRIAGRLSVTEFDYALPSLRLIAADEARHDSLLARAAAAVDGERFRPGPHVRRFFMRMESRDPTTHLSRIASLDGAVCQVLSTVLSRRANTLNGTLPGCIIATLSSIRADEARHVRMARTLARELGQDAASFRAFDLETRDRFADLLGHFDGAFARLDIDGAALRGRIRRHER